MTRYGKLAAALCACVVLAGCMGGGGSGPATPDNTPTVKPKKPVDNPPDTNTQQEDETTPDPDQPVTTTPDTETHLDAEIIRIPNEPI